MGRKEFLNRIYEKCESLDWSSTAKPKEILAAVEKYKFGKKKTAYEDYIISVINGCLFLNGDFILRIEPKAHMLKIWFSETDYYESLCIGDGE